MMDYQSILLSMVGLLKKNVFLSESHVLVLEAWIRIFVTF